MRRYCVSPVMSLECSDGRNSHHSLTLGLGNGRERTPQWVRGPTRQGLPAPRCRAKSVTLITSKKLVSEGMSRVWILGGCSLTHSSLSSHHRGFPSVNLSILASLAVCPRPARLLAELGGQWQWCEKPCDEADSGS